MTLTINRSLTAPVGFETAGGDRRVAVVDKLGTCQGLVPRPGAGSRDRHWATTCPWLRPPDSLLSGRGESLVVAFADGHRDGPGSGSEPPARLAAWIWARLW